MKLTILLLACFVCSAFAWPNKRGPPPDSQSGEEEQAEKIDPCREMARKCRPPPPPPEEEGNPARHLLRETENIEDMIKCFNFLKKEIPEAMRKRGGPDGEKEIQEEASKIIKECGCDEKDEPAGGEGSDIKRLSARLYRLFRGEELAEEREEKCWKALEEAGIELEEDQESEQDGDGSGDHTESDESENGQEVKELLQLLRRLRK